MAKKFGIQPLRCALALFAVTLSAAAAAGVEYGQVATKVAKLLENEHYNDHPIDDEARLLLAANYLLSKKPAQCADVLESPYAVALKENAIGRLLLDRANEQRQR